MSKFIVAYSVKSWVNHMPSLKCGIYFRVFCCCCCCCCCLFVCYFCYLTTLKTLHSKTDQILFQIYYLHLFFSCDFSSSSSLFISCVPSAYLDVLCSTLFIQIPLMLLSVSCCFCFCLFCLFFFSFHCE